MSKAQISLQCTDIETDAWEICLIVPVSGGGLQAQMAPYSTLRMSVAETEELITRLQKVVTMARGK